MRYRFRTRRAYLEQLVHDHEVDWVNSCSCPADSPRNASARTTSSSTSSSSVCPRNGCNYAEGWFAEQNATEAAESITLDDWEVQRRCPHLKADLTRFGSIDGDVLTCQMHGWKWRLTDGKCLTSVGHNIRSARAGQPVP